VDGGGDHRGGERFERRLTEEIFGVRQAITRTDSSLRQLITQTEASLRQEISHTDSSLRQAITQPEASVRKEIVEGDAKVLEALGNVRVELLKWSFALWMGQVVANGHHGSDAAFHAGATIREDTENWLDVAFLVLFVFDGVALRRRP
jgi:hypothetical protein